MGARVEVIGVGYEGATIEEFCAQLQALGVASVADVRLNALSRKRGFSKNGLRSALAESGIAYLHLPDLGNPRENRDGFATPGSPAGDSARKVYLERLETDEARSALGRIFELAEDGVVAVMCFERDEHECHREMVLEKLDGVVASALLSAMS